MYHIENLISYIAWLIAILSPFTAIPYYLLLKTKRDLFSYKKDAWVVASTVFIILSVVLLFGQYIFRMFGLELVYFKIAGSLIVIYISFFMTIGKDFVDHEKDNAHPLDTIWDNPLIIPISMPLLSWPWSIAYTLNLLNTDWSNIYLIWIAILLGSIVVYLSIRYSMYIKKTLGNTGIKLFSRFMGLILLGLSIQGLFEALHLAGVFG